MRRRAALLPRRRPATSCAPAWWPPPSSSCAGRRSACCGPAVAPRPDLVRQGGGAVLRRPRDQGLHRRRRAAVPARRGRRACSRRWWPGGSAGGRPLGALLGLVVGAGLASYVAWRTGVLVDDREALLAAAGDPARTAPLDLPLELRVEGRPARLARRRRAHLRAHRAAPTAVAAGVARAARSPGLVCARPATGARLPRSQRRRTRGLSYAGRRRAGPATAAVACDRQRTCRGASSALGRTHRRVGRRSTGRSVSATRGDTGTDRRVERPGGRPEPGDRCPRTRGGLTRRSAGVRRASDARGDGDPDPAIGVGDTRRHGHRSAGSSPSRAPRPQCALAGRTSQQVRTSACRHLQRRRSPRHAATRARTPGASAPGSASRPCRSARSTDTEAATRWLSTGRSSGRAPRPRPVSRGAGSPRHRARRAPPTYALERPRTRPRAAARLRGVADLVGQPLDVADEVRPVVRHRPSRKRRSPTVTRSNRPSGCSCTRRSSAVQPTSCSAVTPSAPTSRPSRMATTPNRRSSSGSSRSSCTSAR